MRVLLIDKTAGLDSSHERHQAIARQNGVELHVLGPKYWTENGREILWHPSIDAAYQCHRSNVIGKGHYARVWYTSGMMRAMLKARPDIIQLLEEPWSITALQTMVYASILAPHVKVIFYTWENIYRPWNYPARASLLYALIDKTMHARSIAAVCATKGARDVLQQKGYTKPIQVISYGVPQYFFDHQDPKPTNKIFTIGYVGRMVHMKGVDLLIRAVASMPDTQLRLVGSGDNVKPIQSLCNQLGLSGQVEWLPSLEERELPEFIRDLDVLVLPSRLTSGWMEQLGRVLIEAMAVGTPVIGAKTGAIPEVIGDAGMLFDEDDHVGLSVQLGRLKDDQQLRDSLSQKGRERAKRRFTWPRFAESITGFYRSLLDESSTHE